MRNRQKLPVILLALAVTSLPAMVHAEGNNLFLHAGAWHDDDASGRWSNDVFGLGLKRGNTEIGAYKHSYAKYQDSGALNGIALYAMQQKTWKLKGVDTGVFAGITYGYPDWLEYSRGGWMPIAGVTAQYGRIRLIAVPATEKSTTTLMFSMQVADF